MGGEIHFFKMAKRYLHKHGHSIWGLLSTSIFRFIAGPFPAVFVSHVLPLDGIRNQLLQTPDLKRDEDVCNQLFNRAPIGLCVIARDGGILIINRTHCELIGFSMQEALGRSYFSFFVKEDQELLRAVLQRMVDGKMLGHSAVARYESKANAVCYCYLQMTAVIDANGVTTHVAIFLQDFTALQKALNMQPISKPTKPVQWNAYP